MRLYESAIARCRTINLLVALIALNLLYFAVNLLPRTEQSCVVTPPPSVITAPPPAPLPWLIVGIPTVSRSSPAAARYLTDTLAAIAVQLPVDAYDPMRNAVRIVVMKQLNADNPTAPHASFDAAAALYANNTDFEFLTNNAVAEGADGAAHDAGTPNVPGWKVRKQTRDIIAVGSAALNRSRYYLFMEDDFAWCNGTLNAIRHMIDKAAAYYADWISIKFSYGMNGFIVKNGADLAHFLSYLQAHQHRRPPDHLVTEWAAGEKFAAEYKKSRAHVAFRYNMMRHLGDISSLRAESSSYAGCYHEMNSEIMFEVDSFKALQCPTDDLWPCPRSRANWNIDGAVIAEAQRH